MAEDERTVEDLQEELRKRDLPVSGNKDELLARLGEADTEQAAALKVIPGGGFVEDDGPRDRRADFDYAGEVADEDEEVRDPMEDFNYGGKPRK